MEEPKHDKSIEGMHVEMGPPLPACQHGTGAMGRLTGRWFGLDAAGDRLIEVDVAGKQCIHPMKAPEKSFLFRVEPS